jgi:hypothetical protein
MIIGDVDTGIDWTRSDFADSLGKTRILYIWDQNDAIGPGPAGFGYGSEFTKSQIDNTPGSVRQQDTNGHGTAVAGVFAGNGSLTGCAQPAYRYVGIAPLANIIEVKTDFSDAGIIDGVNYVFQKAAALGKDAVVNLSLGSQYGPARRLGRVRHGGQRADRPGPDRRRLGRQRPGRPHPRQAHLDFDRGRHRPLHVHGPTYTANVGTFNDYVLITGWYDPTASFTVRLKGPQAGDTLSCGFGQSKDRQVTSAGKLFIANQHSLFGYGGTPKGRQFEIEIYDSTAANRPRSAPGRSTSSPTAPGNVGKRVDIWIYASQLGAAGVSRASASARTTRRLVGSPADGDSVFAVAAHATKGSWASCAQGGTCAYVVPPTINGIASFSCVGPRATACRSPRSRRPASASRPRTRTRPARSARAATSTTASTRSRPARASARRTSRPPLRCSSRLPGLLAEPGQAGARGARPHRRVHRRGAERDLGLRQARHLLDLRPPGPDGRADRSRGRRVVGRGQHAEHHVDRVGLLGA